MRILCVTNGLGSGGAQRQLVELAIAFKEKGHDVEFLTYRYSPFFNPTLENEGITIICIDEPNYMKRLFKMRRIIRRGNYNAVLSFLEAANFICEFAGIPNRKWKLIVGERSANPGIFKSLKLISYRWFHFFADYVVANSYANMRMIRKINPFLSKSKCRVIYNIIDFKKWKPSNHYFPKKDGKFKIIAVASHRYLKNLNGLIDALSLLKQEELVKIAVDWYGERISEPYFDNSFLEGKKKLVDLKLDGIIKFHPATNSINQKILEADAIGLFSFYEGFPNVICEGMACQKPILCSFVSDLPNLLSNEKPLLFDPANPETIKNALSYLISLGNDELIRIGRKNEEIARENFDKELNVSKYLELLGS
jgi:glycosyltransferase involved in cell wall biosynthesis